MERSAFTYSEYSSGSPNRSRAARDQARRQRSKAQEAQEREDMEREELVSKAKAMQAIAQQMSEHNDMMLAGLQSQSMAADEPPAGPTDFVKRNRAAAGERDGIDKKGRALLARAQVMSGAAVHLDAGKKPTPRRPLTNLPAPADESADLIQAALDEMARGDKLSLINSKTSKSAAAGRRKGGLPDRRWQ